MIKYINMITMLGYQTAHDTCSMTFTHLTKEHDKVLKNFI